MDQSCDPRIMMVKQPIQIDEASMQSTVHGAGGTSSQTCPSSAGQTQCTPVAVQRYRTPCVPRSPARTSVHDSQRTLSCCINVCKPIEYSRVRRSLPSQAALHRHHALRDPPRYVATVPDRTLGFLVERVSRRDTKPLADRITVGQSRHPL
jgi:hypothetical protein